MHLEFSISKPCRKFTSRVYLDVGILCYTQLWIRSKRCHTVTWNIDLGYDLDVPVFRKLYDLFNIFLRVKTTVRRFFFRLRRFVASEGTGPWHSPSANFCKPR